MFREMPFLDNHLAFAAGSRLAANCFDPHPQPARSLQNGGAADHPAGTSGWLKDHLEGWRT